MQTSQTTVFSLIENTIKGLDLSTITNERKTTLQPLINYIQAKVTAKQKVRLHFICTHNSRRSHLSQIWAQTLAHYFNIANIVCYSGGTESTALYPVVASTLKNLGFEIFKISEGENPVYSIKYAANEHPIIGFSKTIDANFNPQSSFAAVMTCDSANEACPFVLGAEQRIPITYVDPKLFDDTPQQIGKYKQSSEQIATELCYVFSQITF